MFIFDEDDLIKKIELLCERSLINNAVPGWEGLVVTNRFDNWLGRQSPDMAVLADSELARDAIKLLKRYISYVEELEASSLYQWAKRKTAASR